MSKASSLYGPRFGRLPFWQRKNRVHAAIGVALLAPLIIGLAVLALGVIVFVILCLVQAFLHAGQFSWGTKAFALYIVAWAVWLICAARR